MAETDAAREPNRDLARDLNRSVEIAAQAHQRLLAALDELIERDALDVAAPSLLPDWTKGHVLTHITNSGEGHCEIFDAAMRGEVGAQYPHGPEGRAADIEAGATRLAPEQRDALRQSIWKLEGRWAASNWQGKGITPNGGEVAVRDLPFLRIREVAIHHIDLDIGYGFEDLPAEYLRLELGRMEMLWKARQPMGLTPLPSVALALAPPQRLAWLMGRTVVDGLDPASIY